MDTLLFSAETFIPFNGDIPANILATEAKFLSFILKIHSVSNV